ncbi:unnamed protein product [Prunus armeniaca]
MAPQLLHGERPIVGLAEHLCCVKVCLDQVVIELVDQCNVCCVDEISKRFDLELDMAKVRQANRKVVCPQLEMLKDRNIMVPTQMISSIRGMSPRTTCLKRGSMFLRDLRMKHVCDWLNFVLYLDCNKGVASLYPNSDQKDIVMDTDAIEELVADEARAKEHVAEENTAEEEIADEVEAQENVANETGAKEDVNNRESPTDVSKCADHFLLAASILNVDLLTA